MSDRPPRISVLTPCLNAARYIGEAIDSVVGQNYPDIEHIVVDGGSTDGTLGLLGRYPHLKVINGPDGGVYDALNKGLAVAKGEIIGILNSDDRYAGDVFTAVANSLADRNIAAVGGDAISFRCSSQPPEEVVHRFTGAGRDLIYQSTLGDPCINAWFFRASVFSRIGCFDADYKVAGDREFMLRLSCSDLPCLHLPQLIYLYRVHPGSMTFGGNKAIWETIAREHDKMTRDTLGKQSLSTRARKLITQARTRDTLRMAHRALRQHEWRRFCAYAAAGIRHDIGWPLRFVKRAFVARSDS
jgi:glycosyltransferase involved in cell wall biosynthesis